MLFQYNLIQFLLLSFLPSTSILIANILLIITAQRNRKENQKFYLFSKVGVINIIWLFLYPNFLLMMVIIIIDPWFYFAITSQINLIVSDAISLVTYGVYFMKIGYSDPSDAKKLLKISGIIWMVTLNIFFIVDYMVLYIPPASSLTFIIFTSIITLYIILISARILFLIYSIKIKDKRLIAAAILLLIATFFGVEISNLSFLLTGGF
ncbi:MAG: hypothetical protein ACFE8V_08190 [Promethearchaeota archaeon]